MQRSLTAYYERFKGLLNPRNAQHIQALLHIGSALHKCLQHSQQQVHEPPAALLAATERQTSSTSRVLTVNDLLFDLGLDNINMLELAAWVKENKMAFKVSKGGLSKACLMLGRRHCGAGCLTLRFTVGTGALPTQLPGQLPPLLG